MRRSPQPTRGYGRLEGFLARQRIAQTMHRIKPPLHKRSVLDIDCGSHPLFLLQAPFTRKMGLDQLTPAAAPSPPGIKVLRHPLGTEPLPFPDHDFDCVVSLAFLEHLDPEVVPFVLREVRRVLKPNGQFVATVPHALAYAPLFILSRIGLVSREEINEHRGRFWRGALRRLLISAGFREKNIIVGGFQGGLNIWMTAEP
jgi:SAM-dependent methyltransferase